jgi:hypothetical protein
MTVLVTVNRYVAVCHPYDATDTHSIKQKARRQVLLVALFSILFNFSRFFEYEIHSGSVNRLARTWLADNPYYKVIS